jgi:uncharacterized OB-fold protein
VIETFMVDHRNLVPGFDEPYAVAVVELLETAGDVRLVANVQGCALDTIHIGMRVRVAFEEISPDVTLPQFVPVDVAEVRP